MVKSGVIVQLTINIKNLFFIVRFLARVICNMKTDKRNGEQNYERTGSK